MKTSRDCVENFWFLRIDHFLKSNMGQAEYCRQHGLKKSSMNGWLSRFREKFPEKFKDRDFFIDCEVTSSYKEDSAEILEPSLENLFIEVKSNKSLKNTAEFYKSEIKFNITINNLTINFSTYPQVSWLHELIRGIK
jgi:hypothetical protein